MHIRESQSEIQARPFLAPTTEETQHLASSPSGVIRAVTATMPSVSAVHFLVHASMREVQQLAQAKGWFARGFNTISIPWTEMHWTLDAWKSSHVLRSTDVPCPVMNGYFFLPNVAVGTEVEFAVHAGVACHASHDTAGNRDTASLWFNNHGRNYYQATT
jgi:hypothetical protein